MRRSHAERAGLPRRSRSRSTTPRAGCGVVPPGRPLRVVPRERVTCSRGREQSRVGRAGHDSTRATVVSARRSGATCHLAGGVGIGRIARAAGRACDHRTGCFVGCARSSSRDLGGGARRSSARGSCSRRSYCDHRRTVTDPCLAASGRPSRAWVIPGTRQKVPGGEEGCPCALTSATERGDRPQGDLTLRCAIWRAGIARRSDGEINRGVPRKIPPVAVARSRLHRGKSGAVRRPWRRASMPRVPSAPSGVGTRRSCRSC